MKDWMIKLVIVDRVRVEVTGYDRVEKFQVDFLYLYPFPYVPI